MKTVTIATPFEGYPDGAHEASRSVLYATGQVVEVPDDFADLITDPAKGLATPGGTLPTPAPAEPVTAEKEARA